MSGPHARNSREMNRRKFIIASLGCLTGFAFLRKAVSSPVLPYIYRPESDDIGSMIAGLFPDPENAKVIGARYLAQYPERSDRNRIIADLGLPSLKSATQSRDSLKSWINESQRRDFAVGNTVIVNNWILSRTEVNLCALIALT